MSPEKQRIALAIWMGWKENGLGPKGTLHDPKGCSCFSGQGCRMPDYINDLNAIHEVEMRLDDRNFGGSLALYDVYADTLRDLFGRSIRATAKQRAEALLRTIGKWVERKI